MRQGLPALGLFLYLGPGVDVVMRRICTTGGTVLTAGKVEHSPPDSGPYIGNEFDFPVRVKPVTALDQADQAFADKIINEYVSG